MLADEWSFPGDLDAVEEEIHQHRFAAADPSPEIDSPHGIGFAPDETRQEALTARLCFQFRNRLAETQSDLPLGVVRAQLTR